MAHSAEYPPLTEELFAEIVRRIVAAGDVLKIVLFGSHGRGEAGAHSDIDLLIVESDEVASGTPTYERSPKYYSATHRTFPPRDIVVRTPEEIDAWSEVPNHFVTTALREGRVLYERCSQQPC